MPINPHLVKDEAFVCEACDFGTNSKNWTNIHKTRIHGHTVQKDDGKINGMKCTYETLKTEEMRQYEIRKDTKHESLENPQTCELCDHNSEILIEFRIHMDINK